MQCPLLTDERAIGRCFCAAPADVSHCIIFHGGGNTLDTAAAAANINSTGVVFYKFFTWGGRRRNISSPGLTLKHAPRSLNIALLHGQIEPLNNCKGVRCPPIFSLSNLIAGTNRKVYLLHASFALKDSQCQ